MIRKLWAPILVLLGVAAIGYAGTSVTTPAGNATSGSSLTVAEEDGNPSASASTLKFTNGAVTDNGDGSVSVAIVASESDTLDTVVGRGASTDNANSAANAVKIGSSGRKWLIYDDATAGLIIEPDSASNTTTRIMTNQTWCLYNVEATECIETVDPDAASVQAMWSYASTYRPLKSVFFPAASLNTDGTQCGQPTERTINSGALRYTIICTDNDASTIYGEISMPDSWDGGTVTLLGSFVQTAADTANINADVAMACRVDGDTINNTWGTEIAMDSALGGSNKIDTVTTAAITPNGTCTGAGTLLQFRWQLDATGTTTAVATLHVLGFKLEYSTKSRSD
jgi:hypothetical protein